MPLARRLRGEAASKVADADNAAGRARARSPRRCSSSTSSATCPGRTSTSPRSATSPADAYEWTDGPTGFGARALLTWLARHDPLAGIGHERADRPLVARRRPAASRTAGVLRRGTSHARFTGMAGLRFKTWRMRRGVVRGLLRLRADEARAAFQATFTAGRRVARVADHRQRRSSIEAVRLVAVAEGWAGFVAAAALRARVADRGSRLGGPLLLGDAAGRHRPAAAPAPGRRGRRPPGRARGSRRSPRRAGRGRRPGRATARCRRRPRRRDAAAAAPP